MSEPSTEATTLATTSACSSPTACPSSTTTAGYRGAVAARAAGISYRQLDYWARTQLVEPTVRGAAGSGSQRLYGFRDILVLKLVKRLLDTGISLQQIRTAVNQLRESGINDLAQTTLMSDGASVYLCTSDDEVIDLVSRGQGVFGIAVGKVLREVESTLVELDAAAGRPDGRARRASRAARARSPDQPPRVHSVTWRRRTRCRSRTARPRSGRPSGLRVTTTRVGSDVAIRPRAAPARRTRRCGAVRMHAVEQLVEVARHLLRRSRPARCAAASPRPAPAAATCARAAAARARAGRTCRAAP